MDEEKIQEQFRKRNTGQVRGRIRGMGDNPDQGLIDRITQIDAVPEAHIYLLSEGADGVDILWQADLLGDRSLDKGHGKLPPVIHIFCPFCSTPEDPRAISITHSNKPYEIEDLQEPLVLPNVVKIDGTEGPFEIWSLLHVKEIIRCPYIEEVEGQVCGARFMIRGSRITRVG